MEAPRGLDDPEYAAFALGRHCRILARMGLMFFRSGTRHDAQVEDLLRDQIEIGD